MNKSSLIVIIFSALAVFWQSNCQAAGIVSLESLADQLLPADFKNTNFTLDEVKNILREKCKKASGADNSTLYKEVEEGATSLMTCLSDLTNLTAIQEEIEIARPIGELDTVFHKYCSKAPEAQKCLRTFNTKIQPCLSTEEKAQNAVMVRVFTNLLGFMCAKGGDQLAVFVAEEGPECLEANKEALSNCVNSSFAEYIPKDANKLNLYDLPELVLAPKHCIDLERFEQCTLHHLSQCREITPVNVAESVFRFIKNETSCKTWIIAKSNERSVLKDSKDTATIHSMEMFSMLAGSLLVFFFNRLLL